MHAPRCSRRLIGAAAIACVAALAPLATIAVTTAPAGAARTAVATPRCSTAGLVAWLNTQGNGAAGSVYYKLELTNLSGHACTITGYLGVSAVDLAGRQLGSAASRDGAHAPRAITLANGATASTVLQIVDTSNYPSSTCRQSTAAGLRVYPPDQTASKIVPYPFSACSRTGPVYLSVEAAQ